jgi:Domain of unknown function (DUF4150)
MTVFANGLEISCTAQANKVIAAFPDVCFTPPQTPATPPGVPIPYPSFAFDSDVKSGTGTVKIGGKTISHKNKSHRKRTTGTEAGCAPKKNVITSVNTGKDYAHAWSPNVKADKEPISRFVDICTNDHSSPNAGTGPMSNTSGAGGGGEEKTKCIVGKYDDIVEECRNSGLKSPEKHHIVPDRVYRIAGGKGGERIAGAPSYGDGINICLSQSNHRGSLQDNPKSVHGNLDNALEQFGSTSHPNRTPGAEVHCETIDKIRLGCLMALFKLVPDPVSQACFDKAVKMVTEQTEPIKDKMGRTKKNPITETASLDQLRS